MILTKLLQIYLPLTAGMGLGWLASRWLPRNLPFYLGKGLFLCGVPVSVFVFLRRTDLSGSIWLAGAAAWGAMCLGLGAMYIVLQHSPDPRATQGTTLLAAMLGNTGYLGFPIALTLFGDAGFAWALFYDLLGTTIGAYGVGALIASHYGQGVAGQLSTLQNLLRNPTLWAFMLALLYRDPFSPLLEQLLAIIAWGAIGLALLLIGLRLGQLTSLHQLRAALWPIGLKMLLVPLTIWLLLMPLPLPPLAKQVIVLQAAMPPAFATVVLTENYALDPQLAVAVVGGGTMGLLLTLPLWLWLTQSI